MEKLFEEFNAETIDEYMGIFENDNDTLFEVKDDEFTKLCDLFVTKCNSEEKLGFEFVKFMEFLMVVFSIRKELSKNPCKSKNFVSTVVGLMEKGSVIKEKTKEDYEKEDQAETEEIIRKLEDETPVYYYGSEEEGEEEEQINHAAVSAMRTTCALIDILNLPNKEYLDPSNFESLPKLNQFCLNQLHDQNEDEDLTRMFSNVIMSVTTLLGLEELEKNVVTHRNQENFYIYMLRAFNDAQFNMLDKIHYFTLLVANYDLCSRFLYPNDFKLVIQVIIRELRANSMYTEGGEEGLLFKDYATALIVIMESKIYSEDYERMLLDRILENINEIIGDFESTVDCIDCCKLVKKVVEFVLDDDKGKE